ncbi:MAG: hypothetical protein JXL80_01500 [Planctomycetes bacterium]|nr:hypothetical protein [Planctomycetota bacterium]
MRWQLGIVLFAAALVLCGGCSPNVDQLRQMRAEPIRVENVARDLDTVMVWFEKPNRPTWRAEAMTTMVRLDAALDPAADNAELHARVVALLKAEYNQPQLKPTENATPESTLKEAYALRSWAVHSLGTMRNRELLNYMVGVIRSSNASSDGGFAVRLGAFDALVPHMERLLADAELRNALLAQLPLIESELDGLATNRQPYRAARNACEFFESKLKSYPALVDLVRAAPSSDLPAASVLQVLEWNYQRLEMGDHRTAPGQALFDTNIEALVTLAWHPSEAVRTQARIILAQYAPMRLLAACGQAIAERRLPAEDAVTLANLLPAADREAGYTPSAATAATTTDAYTATRHQALDALFARIGEVPLGQREIVYARLLAHDPQQLRVRLCGRGQQIIDEDEERVSQHLRYLDRLRTSADLTLSDAERRELVAAMTAVVSKPSTTVRRELTTCLLHDEPLALACAAGAWMQQFGQEQPEPARALVALYMACLESLEHQGASPYDDRARSMFGGRHPYMILGSAMGRPDVKTTEAVATFLRSRSPEMLVHLLSQDMAQRQTSGIAVAFGEYVVLGDTLEEAGATIHEDVRKAGIEILRAGCAAPSEELSLLCCRYLLELGETVPEAAMESAPVRELVEAAAQPAAVRADTD